MGRVRHGVYVYALPRIDGKGNVARKREFSNLGNRKPRKFRYPDGVIAWARLKVSGGRGRKGNESTIYEADSRALTSLFHCHSPVAEYLSAVRPFFRVSRSYKMPSLIERLTSITLMSGPERARTANLPLFGKLTLKPGPLLPRPTRYESV